MEREVKRECRILLLGGSAEEERRLRTMLKQSSDPAYRLERAFEGREGLLGVPDDSFDALLVISSGDPADDLETLRALCAGCGAAVLLLADAPDREFARQATRAGAADCLAAGDLAPPLLDRALRYAMDRRRFDRQLARLAHFDPLTGLPNRNLFRDRIRQALSLAVREGRIAALLLLDLDRFELVNGTLGHPAGDLLLKEISDRISRCLRESDTAARLGGDEFGIFLPVLKAPRGAALVARRILDSLSMPVLLEGQEVFPSAGIGIAVHPFDGKDLDSLLRSAHSAVRQAKAEGGRSFQFFSLAMNTEAADRLLLESRLHRALERNEFLLYYQPQFEVATGRLAGVEALLRWQPPDHPLILPGRFIPLLEETGLIHPVGEWVLRTACAEARCWRDRGMPPFRLAVNLSGRQVRAPGLPERIGGILDETGLEPHRLELELTESTLMEDVQSIVEILRSVKSLGVRLAMDDFGTGYSSLGCLRHFPFDTLKIDRSFISHLHAGSGEETLTRTIISMGHSLGMQVVAEGVETREQLEFLRRNRCDGAQGYLLGRPMPGESLTRLLREVG